MLTSPLRTQTSRQLSVAWSHGPPSCRSLRWQFSCSSGRWGRKCCWGVSAQCPGKSDVYLFFWYKSICMTSTKVQILTQDALAGSSWLLALSSRTPPSKVASGLRSSKAVVKPVKFHRKYKRTAGRSGACAMRGVVLQLGKPGDFVQS